MKKYIWVIIPIIIIVAGVIFFYVSQKGKSNNNNNSIVAEKLSTNTNNTTNENTQNNTQNNQNTENKSENTTNTNTENNVTSENKNVEPTEQEIASYSTKITNKKDTNRQTNISITCNSLNNTIVNPGETFSFCDTVGPSTESKGYKEANVIVKGEETKGLGGGNCQISSTLYNAVLACSELEVVERHAHSAPVPYIEEGKDAAISYGYHDFKFKNNLSNPVKIIATNSNNEINIKLVKVM